MSGIDRWYFDVETDDYEMADDGEYILHSDHEAEVARLRAELQNAAKAALDAVALSCEKEREADALRAEVEVSEKNLAAAMDQLAESDAENARLEAEVEENEKVINIWRRRTERAEAEADALGPDAMRWRHVRDMDPDAVGPAHHVVECGSDSWGNPYYEYVTGEEADQVIDAAMGASA